MQNVYSRGNGSDFRKPELALTTEEKFLSVKGTALPGISEMNITLRLPEAGNLKLIITRLLPEKTCVAI